MKNKILVFAVMAVLLLGIAAVQAHIPGPPDGIDVVRGGTTVNFTWDVNATVVNNITTGYNATVNSGVTWSNGTNTYYLLSGLDAGDVYTVEVWAWNSTGSGNLSNYSASKSGSAVGTLRSRGGSALPIPAIIGGIGLWSAVIFLVLRKRREN